MPSDKIGKSTRYGSGSLPASPLQHSNDDFYVQKLNRSDEEYAMERDGDGLHYPCEDDD